MQNKIKQLAKQKDVLILAHFYQTMDIQQVADVVGDSFELARKAAAAPQKNLLVCGVKFMAEGAKILSPDKVVLLPNPDAGCPMADMITPSDVLKLRAEHPAAAVVCYVNSTAQVKAVSDVCVTSSSALKIVNALPQQEIIFVPDQNLGAYIAKCIPEKTFYFFDGYCKVHDIITVEDVKIARQKYPDAKFLVHPECKPEVVALADGVGSTSFILQTVQDATENQSFIIGTEIGVVERLAITAANKKVYPLTQNFICEDMKKTTLEQVLNCLNNFEHEIQLDEQTREKANLVLTRMIEIG